LDGKTTGISKNAKKKIWKKIKILGSLLWYQEYHYHINTLKISSSTKVI